ncbi:hypothetical protein [Bdellovibrio sp. HCB337]|uniref:hypothetical protein n=1 Tax=Bdellovibrio sp. HCB337 TaxID=3394358 RepID=UPI0039A6B645
MKTLFLFLTTSLFLQITNAQEKPSQRGEIRFGALPSIQSYSLSGTGFQASNGSSSGNGTSVGLTWMRELSAITLDYQNLLYAVTPPSDLTPTKIDSRFTRGILAYERLRTKQDSSRIFNYFVALEYRDHKADTTTPNVFMPTRTEGGVTVGLTYSKQLDEIFQLSANAGLFIPLFMNEASDKTGYYKTSINPDIGFRFVYHVNHFIDFSVGAQVFYSQIIYTGTGERGVTDAKESSTNVIAPVELRFKF